MPEGISVAHALFLKQDADLDLMLLVNAKIWVKCGVKELHSEFVLNWIICVMIYFFLKHTRFHNECLYLWRKTRPRESEQKREAVCFCIFPKTKKQRRNWAKLQTTGSTLCSVLQCLQRKLFMKSLSVTRELPLCSVPPSISIYFHGRFMALSSIEGFKPKPKQIKKL